MKNSKKLELTLCGMLPYALKGKRKDGENGLYTLSAVYDKERHSVWRPDDFGDSTMLPVLPLLHSLEKLNEPILPGGLIPIQELLRFYNENIGDLSKIEFHDVDGCTLYGFQTDDSFEVSMPISIYEKLKDWHFNVYHLPKEMYIEKNLITNK